MKKTNWLLAIIVCILFAFIMTLPACTTQKQVNTSRITVDSSVLKEIQDSLHVMKDEKTRLEQMITEMEYGTVVFDSTRCPQIHFPEGAALLNKDSIQTLITDLNNSINGLNNKIKKYADGSIEISGRLKSATYQKEKESQVIIELQNKIDSLKNIKQKEDVRYVTNTVTKEKKVKRSWFTGWWLWLIFFAGGYYVRGRFGKILGFI